MQDDWGGWIDFNGKVGEKVQTVGDDLTVTNIKRIKTAADKGACNALLLKVKSRLPAINFSFHEQFCRQQHMKSNYLQCTVMSMRLSKRGRVLYSCDGRIFHSEVGKEGNTHGVMVFEVGLVSFACCQTHEQKTWRSNCTLF